MELIYEFDDGKKLYLEAPISPPPPPPPPPDAGVIPLSIGPQLFIDDFLIEESGPVRVVKPPLRNRTTPILSSAINNLYTFLGAVVRDPVTGEFKLWHVMKDAGGNSYNVMRRSSGGSVTWSAPETVQQTPLGLSIFNITDEGPEYSDTLRRYKTILPTWPGVSPRWSGDLWTSPDGVTWNLDPASPVVPGKYGETWCLFRHGNGYKILHRNNIDGFTWVDSSGIQHTNTLSASFVRTFAVTSSLGWAGFSYPPSVPVFVPDNSDAGETQFYSVSNIQQRGDLLLGMLHIYHDELKASGSGVIPGATGTGYTVLVFSRDGIHWQRDLVHYFDPAPANGAWDHAITWISSIVPVEDETYLYYFGSHYGHSYNNDRGAGLLTIKRDRYVARQAFSQPSVLRTKVVSFSASGLSINSRGSVRIRVTDPNGAVIPGFDFSDTTPISNDGVDNPWNAAGLIQLSNRPVRLEFELTNAELYGFNLKG